VHRSGLTGPPGRRRPPDVRQLEGRPQHEPSRTVVAKNGSGGHRDTNDEVFHDDDHVLRTRPSCSTTRTVPTGSWIRLTACMMPSSTTAPASTSSTATWPASVLVNVRQFTGIPQERRHPRRQHAPLDQVGATRTGPVCRPGSRSCSPAIPAPARRRLCRAPRPSSTQRCGWSWPRRSSRPTSASDRPQASAATRNDEALPLSLTIAATLCVLNEVCDAHVHDRVQCSRAHLD
jgi:hypothetical protein